MTAAETLYRQIGEGIEGAQNSQMFGKPCFKVNGKAFMSFFQDAIVFKLSGNSHLEALNLKGAQLFDPSGKQRPMKEWVQLPFEHQDFWKSYALAAIEYIKQQQP